MTEFYILCFLLFFILLFLFIKINQQNKLGKERNELQEKIERSQIEVINSDELSDFLKSMELDERLKFKSNFLKRYDLSPFADYYDIRKADIEQQNEFQKFMKEKKFEFNKEITLKSNNKTMNYRPLKNYEKTLEGIEEQENKYPDKSLDKLSGNFRFGY